MLKDGLHFTIKSNGEKMYYEVFDGELTWIEKDGEFYLPFEIINGDYYNAVAKKPTRQRLKNIVYLTKSQWKDCITRRGKV